MLLNLKSYYSRPGGLLHFLSVLFFTSDSVHLCGGGEFYSGQDLRDTFQVTFKSQHGGRSFPLPRHPSVGWCTLGPTREEGGDDKITLKTEWSQTCTLRGG